jgi:hypothetical protein
MKALCISLVGILIAVVVFSGGKKSEVLTPAANTNIPAVLNADIPAMVNVDSEPPLNIRSRTFNGYTCTDDCSGHEAGYEWAEEQGVDDPDDCDGKSESFIEGCQSYAEQQQAEMAASLDDDGEND